MTRARDGETFQENTQREAPRYFASTFESSSSLAPSFPSFLCILGEDDRAGKKEKVREVQ